MRTRDRQDNGVDHKMGAPAVARLTRTKQKVAKRPREVGSLGIPHRHDRKGLKEEIGTEITEARRKKKKKVFWKGDSRFVETSADHIQW